MTIGGITYQSEYQQENTGVWTGTCGGSNSEWLNCNGYIAYTTAGDPSARTLSSNELEKSEMAASNVHERPNELEIIASQVSIYPNPAHAGEFSITLPEPVQTAIISVFDNQGRLLYQKITEGREKLEFSKFLKAGVYHINVRSNPYSITKKLIVN